MITSGDIRLEERRQQKLETHKVLSEYAAMAMQGLLTNPNYNIANGPYQAVAWEAINQAKALLAELKKAESGADSEP